MEYDQLRLIIINLFLFYLMNFIYEYVIFMLNHYIMFNIIFIINIILLAIYRGIILNYLYLIIIIKNRRVIVVLFRFVTFLNIIIRN
jgi:hypothetical protein